MSLINSENLLLKAKTLRSLPQITENSVETGKNMENETLSLDPPQNTSNRSGRNFLRATFLEVPFTTPIYRKSYQNA